MNKLKYIIDDHDCFMIFSNRVVHSDAACILCRGLDPRPTIVGAGFIDLIDGVVFCYGESISLDVKSRKQTDSAIIAKATGMML